MTPATVTGDDVTQNLDAIKTDLKNIEAAQGDLSSARRSEAEAANKAGVVTALDQLAPSYQKAFAPLNCD